MEATQGTDPESKLRKQYYRIVARGGRSKLLRGEATITVEDIIAEMKANTHGPDLSPASYEEIRRYAAEQLLEDEAGRFQPIIDEISAEIRERLAEKGMTLPQPVFAAQFPHGSFNAQTRAETDGLLILVNTGLFMFIYQMVKVATLATRFTDFDENRVLVEHPEIPAAGQSQEEITSLLTDSALAYILQGDSTLARRLPALGGVRGTLLSMLVHACETFTVAHEFGHVLDGHFSNPEPVLDPDMMPYFRKDHLKEYNADQIAAALLIAGIYQGAVALSEQPSASEQQSAQLRLSAMATIAGPFLFFSLSQLIDQVRRRVLSISTSEPAEVSTHPPPEERSFQLRAFVTRQNAFDLSLADAYAEFFTSQTDLIVAEAQRRFEEAPPGAKQWQPDSKASFTPNASSS